MAILLAAVTIHVPGTVSAYSGSTSNPASNMTATAGFCKNPAAPIMTTGWESGAPPDAQFSGANGAITTDATVVRSGSYAYKVAKANGTNSYVRENTATQVLVVRFAVRFAALPAASVRIVDINGTGTLPTVGYDQPSGKLKVAIGANSQLSASTISAETWYRLDVRFDHSATTRAVDWQLDGVGQTQVTKTGESATNVTQFYLGSDVGTDVYTAWFDDLTLTSTSGDYPLGDGRVQALRPDAVSAFNDPVGSTVKDETGANVSVATPGAAAKLRDIPMTSSADYIKHIGANNASYAELSFADTARNSCVNAVQATVAQRGSNATGGIGASYVYDGATQRTLAASATISGTTLAYKTAVITPASGSWTPAKLNGLVARVGYSSNATAVNYPRWDALVLDYDTLPNPAVSYEAAVLADGPVAYWHLGDTSGTTVTAQVGPSGTWTGTPTLGDASLVGDTGTAVWFSGDDYADFTDVDDFTGNAPFTIEAWVNAGAGVSTYRRMVEKLTASTGGWGLAFNSGNNKVFVERDDSAGAFDFALSTTSLTAGLWYHVAGTYDGASLRIYVNGTLEATSASSKVVPDTSVPIRLGKDQWASTDWHVGALDEVAIYPYALQQSQLQAHYNAGRL